jgi:hypothetical protein
MTIVKSSGIPRPFNLTAEEAMELARAAVTEISKLADMAKNFVEGSTTEKQFHEKSRCCGGWQSNSSGSP